MAKDKSVLRYEAQERIKREMTEDERCRAFFKPYNEDSVKTFIEQFSEAKATLEIYGDFTKFRSEDIMDDYHKGAWNALKEIQLKKLFDLECEWRAEKITDVPDVFVTKDFYQISKNIWSYDGISPVSERDIQVYQLYLEQKQTVVYYILNYTSYPDYEHQISKYQNGEATGDGYFDFHCRYTADQGLLLLPDIRGEKEKKYLNARHEHYSRTPEAEVPKKLNPTERKPHLSTMDKDLDMFGAYIGDEKTVKYIKDRWEWTKEKPDMIFSWAFNYLTDIAPEKIAIEANEDWKEALYFAAIHHRNKAISELLPSVHEEYLMKREMGLLVPEDEDQFKSTLSEIFRQHILDGREALGEPRDFKF